jgi:hypothetical protein
MADLPLDPIPIPERYNRRPTVDDMDDVDDEDGAVMEEDALDTDLTLHPVDPAEITGPGDRLIEEDESARRGKASSADADDDDLDVDKLHL